MTSARPTPSPTPDPLRFDQRPVAPEGSSDACLYLIGEAPGGKEAELGRPFVGPAGEALRDMMRDGWNRLCARPPRQCDPLPPHRTVHARPSAQPDADADGAAHLWAGRAQRRPSGQACGHLRSRQIGCHAVRHCRGDRHGTEAELPISGDAGPRHLPPELRSPLWRKRIRDCGSPPSGISSAVGYKPKRRAFSSAA